MALAQGWYLRRDLSGIEGGRVLAASLRIGLAAAALAGVSYGVWYGLDQALGRSLAAQIVSLGLGIAAGIGIYILGVWVMRLEEARQIARLLGARFRRT
jgi:putative peptidoglycan lipid II flippase